MAKVIGRCKWCHQVAELDLDFDGCVECAEKYAKEQEE